MGYVNVVLLQKHPWLFKSLRKSLDALGADVSRRVTLTTRREEAIQALPEAGPAVLVTGYQFSSLLDETAVAFSGLDVAREAKRRNERVATILFTLYPFAAPPPCVDALVDRTRIPDAAMAASITKIATTRFPEGSVLDRVKALLPAPQGRLPPLI